MLERVEAELMLIRSRFPEVEYLEDGCWFRMPSYPLPEGWSRSETDVAFQIAPGYPGQPPYGFYVPSGILFQDNTPKSYTDHASAQPPFCREWGFFSWAPVEGQWKPAVDVRQGSNLLNWVSGFGERFRDGR